MSATRITNRFSRIALAQYHNLPPLFCRGDRKYVSTVSNQLICPHGQEELHHQSMLHWLRLSSSSPQVTEETAQSGSGLENKANTEAPVSDVKAESGDIEPDLSRDDLVKLLKEKEQLLLSKQEELEKMKDEVLMTLADMENVKDRTRRESESAKKFAIQNFAKSLLDVADNMGRASLAAKESFSKIGASSDTSGAVQQLKILLEGVEMTEKQLSEVFRKFGLEKYDPIDEEFDPNRHDAVFQIASASKPVNHVAVVLKVRLSVEVPAAVCDDCYRRVLKELMKRSKVPGFRPGKNVPEDILIGYVGKEIVKKAIVESILERTLPHALSSVSGRAFEDSIRILTKFPEMENTYSSLKFLRYDVIVDVAPELNWIPDDGYKNLKIVVEIDKEIDAVTAAEQELRRRLKALGTLRIVTDRGLEIGDVAILDISATTIEQDESTRKTIPSAESKDFQFDTEDGDRVLPDFLNSIAGMKRGETKSFPYVFPDSWKQEDLRGVCAQFTVECKELFYRDLPELNDSLADKILNGCTTIAEVNRILLQKFIELEQTAKEQATDNAILDQLHKMVEVEIPPSLFEEQGRQLYGAQLLQIQANKKLDEQQLASLSSPKAVKNFLENNRESITSIIKQNLAVGDIFKRENLQILTDELVKEVENSTAEFKSHNQEYDEARVKAQVQDVLEGAKVLEWLRERADIQYITK